MIIAKSNNIGALKAWVKKNGAWNNSHTVYICATCSKSFSHHPSAQAKFCSRECSAEHQKQLKGNLAMNWKGGKSYNNKCIDCQTHVSFASKRCKKCAAVLMPHLHIKEKPWLRTKQVIKKMLRRRPISSLEVKFQQIIDKHELPYKYVGNGKFFIERKNPDFININGEKKAVEVYAKRHKENLRNTTIAKWKKDRQEIFTKYGWKIIFFDEVELTEENVVSTLKGGINHF